MDVLYWTIYLLILWRVHHSCGNVLIYEEEEGQYKPQDHCQKYSWSWKTSQMWHCEQCSVSRNEPLYWRDNQETVLSHCWLTAYPFVALTWQERPTCLSVCLFYDVTLFYIIINQSVWLSVCLIVCQSVCLSIWLSDCLSICLSVCLCLSVCQSEFTFKSNFECLLLTFYVFGDVWSNKRHENNCQW